MHLTTHRLYTCLLLTLLAPLHSLAGEPRPNIVLLLSDDQSWTDYGFMGHEHIETPNLDKLADRSALFTRGYVPTALCRSSLATLATGLYTHQHKISGNDPSLSLAEKDTPEYNKLRAQLIANIDRQPTLFKLVSGGRPRGDHRVDGGVRHVPPLLLLRAALIQNAPRPMSGTPSFRW